MLTNQQIRDRAIQYLISNNSPIKKETCNIVLPQEETCKESKEFLTEYNIARVSFDSNFDPDYPNQDLLPYAFIVYVNLSTGEVSMVRHM